MKKVKEYKDPYKLDLLVSDNFPQGAEIPALTTKNSRYIESVVELDSNYRNDSTINPPGELYKDIISSNRGKLSQIKTSKNYVGSTKYWFDAMKNCSLVGYTFEELIRGALININLTNSTRISNKSILGVADKLYNRCRTLHNLNDMLLEPFDPNNTDHIISIIAEPLELGDKCKLSLATKFCAYATQYLLDNVLYSKYDRVVSDNLGYYIDFYLTNQKECEEIIRNKYKINNSNFIIKTKFKPAVTSDSDFSRFESYLQIYFVYDFYIDKILNAINLFPLNKNTMDHIIWYSKK